MLKQSLNFKLLQKLSPQQIQLMKLIQLPTQAFEQKLEQELEENPALESGKENNDEFSDNEINDNYDNLDGYLKHLSDLKLDNQIKNRILKKTYRLENSKEWLLEKDNNIEKYINV